LRSVRSYEEIALALGVTGGAVRQLLNRARNSLRSAAAAITPIPLLTRLASGDSAEPVAARVAEMVGMGAAGSGALMAKVCATALVTGAVVGGIAVTPDSGRNERGGTGVGAEAAEAAEGRSADADSGGAVPGPSGSGSDRAVGSGERDGSDADERLALRDDDRSGRREGGGGDDDGTGDRGDGPEGDRSGGGDGAAQEPEDHSAPGGGLGEDEVREEAATSDNSGPGGGWRRH
jgi:hypothetical protein